jgi:hypothetical protein
MWQKIKDYLLFTTTLIAIVLFVMLLNKCGDALNKYKIENQKDTIITHKTDTVWARDTVFSFKKIKVPVPQVDTLYKPIYVDTNDCRRIFVYKDSLVDTNLVIYYKDYIQGILRGKELSYKLKVPLRIYDSTTTIIKINPKFELYGTLMLSKGMIAPMGEIGLKRFKIGFGYNLNTKAPVGSISYKLYSK